MAVTPQTNTTLREIADALMKADNIVIGGHVGPDGDCIGSQLALANTLRLLGKTVTCTLAMPKEPPAVYDFLPGFNDLVYADDFKGRVDTFVAVDVPTKERLDEAQWALHEKASLTITIDHHAVDTCMAKLSYTDPDSASTTLLVWQIAKMLCANPGKDVATCAFLGLMTDTGSWRHQNSNAESFALAAEMVQAGADASECATMVFQRRHMCSVKLEGIAIDHMTLTPHGFAVTYLSLDDFDAVGATSDDAEGIVEVLRSLNDVRVACVLREMKGAKGVYVKGSFRAKDDTDVAAIAQRHSGGGHKAAAGFRMFCPIKQAADQLCEELESVLGAE